MCILQYFPVRLVAIRLISKIAVAIAVDEQYSTGRLMTENYFGLRVKTLSRATALGVCHKKFKHTLMRCMRRMSPIFQAQFILSPNKLRASISCGIHSYKRAGTVSRTC